MNNSNLKKYLAEGKLYEAINLDIEDGIAYLDGDSGTYEAEIEDGKASFSIMYDDLDYRISDQYDENNIEDFLGKGHAFVELAKKYDHNWDIERDLVGITIKLKDLAEGKLNEEKYTPGSGWTKDFDYDGMLNLALTLDASSPMDLLLKVSSDLEDVNYHRENSHLTDAIDAIKAGDRVEAKIAINRFRKEIKKP
jgi:hypothetical protein